MILITEGWHPEIGDFVCIRNEPDFYGETVTSDHARRSALRGLISFGCLVPHSATVRQYGQARWQPGFDRVQGVTPMPHRIDIFDPGSWRSV